MTDPSQSPGDDYSQANRVDLICDAFEQAWLAGNEPSINDFLSDVAGPERSRLFRELLAMDVEYRKKRGEQVGPQELVERFPEFETVARQLFEEPTLAAPAADPFATHHSTSDTSEVAREFEAAKKQLGDYELVDELGVGGMGVVYRARQRGANREVALKVIRSDRLGEGPARNEVIERFRTEAQAAAQLEHEGIVTVYDVGEIDGQHFFSMRYVDGRSLSDILRDGPLDNRRAARYTEQVARALFDAHSHGVLHRDLKPQNILIDNKTDKALVADFGLAKLQEGPSELTRYGDIMGTPPYMPPEQATDATSATALSDVYSIGATLYHLLTGRPPFQAATIVDTIQQVINDDPVAPRLLNGAVDRDLETICLKCLEKEQNRRYASAEELAEELSRYQNAVPIRARRIGAAGRTMRWCRRNPGWAAAIGSVFLGLSGFAAVLSVAYVKTSAAQQASEEGFKEAQHAFDQIVDRIRKEGLFDEPAMQDLKEDLLREALQYYEGFLAKRADDPAIQDEVAATYVKVGVINEQIVSADKALEAFTTARELQEQLHTEDPHNVPRLEALGDTLNSIGRVSLSLERLEEARAAVGEAIRVRQQLVDAATSQGLPTEEYERVLINSHMNLGVLEEHSGNTPGAIEHYQRAQSRRKQSLQRNREDARLLHDYGIGFYNLAHLEMGLEDHTAAEAHFRAAAEQFRHAARFDPDDNRSIHLLSLCLRLLGDGELDDFIQAQEDYIAALDTLQPLADDDPDSNQYQEDLAQIYINLGQLQYEGQQLEPATVAFKQAHAILGRLHEKDPTFPNYQRNLALTLFWRSRILVDQDDGDDARGFLDQSRKLLQSLTAGDSDPLDGELLEETEALLKTLPK